MKKILLPLLVLSTALHGEIPDLSFGQGDVFKPTGVSVQNRVLCRVQGKAISVRDVTTALDESFDRDFPQYAENPEARQQYYLNSWRLVLDDLINRELILADAEDRNLPIPHGDIREEMEGLFGPDMLSTLDNEGLSFEEAWELVREEIALRRMLMMRVNSRAYAGVTPVEVRAEYDTYCAEHAGKERWNYRVVSIRGEDSERAAEVAAEAYRLLTTEGSDHDDLGNEFTQRWAEENVKVSVSRPMENSRGSFSDQHWAGVAGLESGQLSEPLLQTSRNGDRLFRIYLVDEKTLPTVPLYHEVEDEFRDRLLQEAMGRERTEYMAELHEKFEVEPLYNLERSGQELFVLN